MNNIIDGLFTGIGVIISFSFVFILIVGIFIFLIKFLDGAHYHVICILRCQKEQWYKFPINDRRRINLWFFFSPKKIRKFDSNLKMGMSIKGAYESTINQFAKE